MYHKGFPTILILTALSLAAVFYFHRASVFVGMRSLGVFSLAGTAGSAPAPVSSSKGSAPARANSGEPSPVASQTFSASLSSPLAAGGDSREPLKGARSGTSSTAELGGTPIRAVVEQNGRRTNLAPDAMGNFPRVLLKPHERVKVAVSYPDGAPDEPVVLQSEDGGQLDQGDTVKQLRLDASRSVVFEFESDRADGIYRVTSRKGFDEKRLEFWVGPEPQPRE